MLKWWLRSWINGTSMISSAYWKNKIKSLLGQFQIENNHNINILFIKTNIGAGKKYLGNAPNVWLIIKSLLFGNQTIFFWQSYYIFVPYCHEWSQLSGKKKITLLYTLGRWKRAYFWSQSPIRLLLIDDWNWCVSV